MKSLTALSIFIISFFVKLSLGSNPKSVRGILKYSSQDEANKQIYSESKKNFVRNITFSDETKPENSSDKMLLISPKNSRERSNFSISSPSSETDSMASSLSSSNEEVVHVQVRELRTESTSPSLEDSEELSSLSASLDEIDLDPTGIWELIFNDKKDEAYALLKAGDRLGNKNIHLETLAKNGKYVDMISFLGKTRRKVLNEPLERKMTILDFALQYEQENNIDAILKFQDDIPLALNKVFKYATSHPKYKLPRFFLDNCSAKKAYGFIRKLMSTTKLINSNLYSACVNQLDLSHVDEKSGETLLHLAIRKNDFNFIYWVLKRPDSNKFLNIFTGSGTKLSPLDYAMKYIRSAKLIETEFKNYESLLDWILLLCEPEVGLIALKSFQIYDKLSGIKWNNLFEKLKTIHFKKKEEELLPVVESVFMNAVNSKNSFKADFISEKLEKLTNEIDRENDLFESDQFPGVLGKRSFDEEKENENLERKEKKGILIPHRNVLKIEMMIFIFILMALSLVDAATTIFNENDYHQNEPLNSSIGIKRKVEDEDSFISPVSPIIQKKRKKVAFNLPVKVLSDSEFDSHTAMSMSLESDTALVRLDTMDLSEYFDEITEKSETGPQGAENITDLSSEIKFETLSNSAENEALYWSNILENDFIGAMLMKIQGIFLSGSLENFEKIKKILSEPVVNETLLKHLSSAQPHIFFQKYNNNEVNIFEDAHVNQVKYFLKFNNLTVHLNILTYACQHPESIMLDDEFFSLFGMEGFLKRIEIANKFNVNEYLKQCYVKAKNLVKFDEDSAFYGQKNVLTDAINRDDKNVVRWILSRSDAIDILDAKVNDQLPIVIALLSARRENTFEIIAMLLKRKHQHISDVLSLIDIMFSENRLDETLEFFIYLIDVLIPQHSSDLLSELRKKYNHAILNSNDGVISFFKNRRQLPFFQAIFLEPEATIPLD